MKEYVNSQGFESAADVMSAMKEMSSDVIQQVMECEMDDMLGYEKSQRVAEEADRNADGMEERIIGLYACGVSQRDIAEQIKALYDVDISPELVSKISEKIMPEVTAWQNRPLEAVYPFMFMDVIHYKVKENHRYITKAA